MVLVLALGAFPVASSPMNLDDDRAVLFLKSDIAAKQYYLDGRLVKLTMSDINARKLSEDFRSKRIWVFVWSGKVGNWSASSLADQSITVQ